METLEKIIDYFKENEDIFNNCIEELDNYNGYLGGDNKYWEMEKLPELLGSYGILDILNRAYSGYDDDYGTGSSFNPNSNFFSFNGCGNLISSRKKDYSMYIDEYTARALADNVDKIPTIGDDDELSALFDEFINEKEV